MQAAAHASWLARWSPPRAPGFSRSNPHEKDSTITIPDSFIVSLHVKLAIKCIQNSRKERFHNQPVVILFKNDCFVRHMFCTIFVSLSVAKILEKYVRSSSYLLKVFFKKNSHSHGTFTERLFLLQFLYIKVF